MQNDFQGNGSSSATGNQCAGMEKPALVSRGTRSSSGSHRDARRASLLAVAVALAIAGAAQAASFSAGTEAELIQTINAANASSGADVINVSADITLSAALPTITDALTIQGRRHRRRTVGGRR